jgi:hypothetical protein
VNDTIKELKENIKKKENTCIRQTMIRFFRDTANYQEKQTKKNLEKLKNKRDNRHHESRKIARALKMLGSNRPFTGASKALSQTSIAALDTTKEERIRALYPEDSTSNEDEPEPKIEHTRIVFTMNKLIDELNCMARFKKAPGRSRIEARHLLFLVTHSKPFAIGLLEIATALANGEVQDTEADFLKIALGVPVSKTESQDAGIRPLGINESVLNLISRLLIKSHISLFRDALHSLDFGCLSRGGCESVIHGINAIWRLTPEDQNLYIIATDFSNAFNTAYRSKIIDMIRRKVPQLLPYITWRYENMQVLFRDAQHEFMVACVRGVSQGEPLSGILFQMLVSEILHDVRLNVPETPILSYHDDNNIVSKNLTHATTALKQIEAKASEYGLKLNLEKTKIVSRFPLTEQQLIDNPILASLIKVHGTGSVPLETRAGDAPCGTIILGGVIGSDEFIREETIKALDQVLQRIAQTKEMIEMHSSPHSPIADKPMVLKLLQFIRLCVGSMSNYAIRVTRPDLCAEVTVEIDHAIAECTLELANQPRFTLVPPEFLELRTELQEEDTNIFDKSTKSALIMKRMFMNPGGLAIPSAYNTRDAAYAGSIALVAPHIAEIVQCIYPNTTSQEVIRTLGVESVDARMYQAIEAIEEPSRVAETYAKFAPIYDPRVQQPGKQKTMNSLMKKQAGVEMLRDARALLDVNRFDAKLVSRCAIGASAFLHDYQEKKYNALSDQACRDNILLSIGCEPFANEECAACGKPIAPGTAESHSRACKHAHHSVAGTYVKRATIEACKLLMLNPSSHEPRTEDLMTWTRKTPLRVDEPKTRADFEVELDGVNRICDVTVTAVYESVQGVRIGRKAPAANKAEMLKIKQYNRDYHIPRNSFYPIGFESHGAWGEKATELLTDAKKSYASRMGKSNVWQKVKIAISNGICRCNTAYLDRIRLRKVEKEKNKTEEAPKVEQEKINEPEETIQEEEKNQVDSNAEYDEFENEKCSEKEGDIEEEDQEGVEEGRGVMSEDDEDKQEIEEMKEEEKKEELIGSINSSSSGGM